MPDPGEIDVEGILVIDKPRGLTSHDVVARVRRLARTRRVGHAGTLDPMATGVLVIGIGRATRLLGLISGTEKSYSATIRLGQASSTDDAEGEVRVIADASGLPFPAVLAAIEDLSGAILQQPSAVSAIKVAGKRAYQRVRAGEDVELAARPVVVRVFDVLARRPDPGAGVLDLDVEVVCSSGTYIRALARDLGAALGVGGHLTALRRDSVGGFAAVEAQQLAELEADPDALPAVVMSLSEAAAAQFPVLCVGPDQAGSIRHGRPLDLTAVWAPYRDLQDELAEPQDWTNLAGELALLDQEEQLLALVAPNPDGTTRYLAVFATDPPPG